MEPIDSEMEYIVHPSEQPIKSGSRLTYMLILPILGVILLAGIILTAIFQVNVSDFIDPLMGIMALLFIVMVAMLFWALSPKAYNPKA